MLSHTEYISNMQFSGANIPPWTWTDPHHVAINNAGRNADKELLPSSLLLRIHASELASVCGLHPFVTMREAMLAVCERHSLPVSEEMVPSVGSQQTATATQQLTASQLAEANSMAAVIVSKTTKLPDQKAKCVFLDAERKLSSSSVTAVLPAVKNAVLRQVYQSRGVAKEPADLCRIAIARKEPSRPQYFKKQMFSMQTSKRKVITVELVGVVDGLTSDGSCVIESKHRMKRLFHHVPMYEKIQVAAYVWLSGAQRALHVESFAGQQLTTPLTAQELTDEIWPSLRNGLAEFVVQVNKASDGSDRPTKTDEPETMAKTCSRRKRKRTETNFC